VAGACEYGNELSSSIKCGEILDLLQNQLASQEGLCSVKQVSISDTLRIIYIISNNGRHPVAKTITLSQYTYRNFNSSHIKLHPITLH